MVQHFANYSIQNFAKWTVSQSELTAYVLALIYRVLPLTGLFKQEIYLQDFTSESQ